MKVSFYLFFIIISGFYLKTASACDGAHGEFSMPGLIISEESNRISASFGLESKETEEDGLVQTKSISFSYTRQLKDSGLQIGAQLPVFNTVNSIEETTFVGDLKLYLFYPVDLPESSFSGIYGKLTLPTSGSGHEKGHTKAEYDGSTNTSAGLFYLKVLPEGFDLTANADLSYYFQTTLDSLNGEPMHHSIPVGPSAPTSPIKTEEDLTLSNGFGYSANIGFGYSIQDFPITRIGARIGHMYRSTKVLREEIISSTNNWTISTDLVGSINHKTSLGMSINKSLSGTTSIGMSLFFEFKF